VADAPFAPPALESRRPVPRPALGYVFIWTAVTLWSLNAVLAKVALDSAGVSAFRLAEVRATGSALILIAVVLVITPGSMRTTRRELANFAVFGVLGLGVVQLFYFIGIRRLDITREWAAKYVADDAKWSRAEEELREALDTAAIAEQYVEGRELYVGVLGNDRLRTFPVWEMDFGTLPEVMARADAEAELMRIGATIKRGPASYFLPDPRFPRRGPPASGIPGPLPGR